jgi:hypothetical protein
MRLDARKGDTGYSVYHVERCEKVKHVVWVDDVTNEYGAYPDVLIRPPTRTGNLSITVHKARNILINTSTRLVLINPVDDSDDVQQGELHSVEMA